MPEGNTTPEPVTSKGKSASGVRNNSAGRVMSIKGAPSAVAKGDLSPRKGLTVVNKG